MAASRVVPGVTLIGRGARAGTCFRILGEGLFVGSSAPCPQRHQVLAFFVQVLEGHLTRCCLKREVREGGFLLEESPVNA